MATRPKSIPQSQLSFINVPELKAEITRIETIVKTKQTELRALRKQLNSLKSFLPVEE